MLHKKKYIPVIGIITLFVLSSITLPASPSVTEEPAQNVQNVKAEVNATIALVLSTGGLGDFGFNDLAYKGLMDANKTYTLDYDWVEPDTVPEINTFIESYASSTTKDYDLIIAIGFSAEAGVKESAVKHPDQNYMILDFDLSVAGLDNVASTSFLEHEGSFLVGAMAAMTTESDTIGFLGGEEVPLIEKFQAGYEQGALHINPDIKILVQYAPDQSNPWNDVTGGKTVAENFIDKDADVIYAAAGETGLGMFDAIKDETGTINADGTVSGNRVWAIGVDADQDGLEKGYILCSMVKRVDVAVERQIGRIATGLAPIDMIAQGLEDGMVGISNMTYTQTQKDTIWEGTKTRYEAVMDLKDDIIAGDIIVSSTVPESAPGFEFAGVVFGLFVIATIPLIRRKRKY
ncbi:BMP family ABC transporter substrate-binding protein [Candidatus Pacearchaeota archaeon]|nr:BMP family ABC transporter substrate-binding protein [Candidatus Pacearchaeota archaeon]